MLVEKYRPNSFSDVICRSEIISDLKKQMESKDGIPHLLFHGCQGSGKTTLAHVIGHELFKANKKTLFHEINASSDRGIDVIREKVTDLCKVKPFGYPYKIIFMDEADHLTIDAQACFRRIIETYSGHVRFIFACNNVYKLIPAIISRLVKYEFATSDVMEVAKRLKKICASEGLNHDDKTIVRIAKKAKSDIRSAVNMLESSTIQSSDALDSLTWDSLLKMDKNERIKLAFVADPDTVFQRIWELIQENNKWEYLDILANAQASMNYAAVKQVFIANVLEKIK